MGLPDLTESILFKLAQIIAFEDPSRRTDQDCRPTTTPVVDDLVQFHLCPDPSPPGAGPRRWPYAGQGQSGRPSVFTQLNTKLGILRT